MQPFTRSIEGAASAAKNRPGIVCAAGTHGPRPASDDNRERVLGLEKQAQAT